MIQLHDYNILIYYSRSQECNILIFNNQFDLIGYEFMI